MPHRDNLTILVIDGNTYVPSRYSKSLYRTTELTTIEISIRHRNLTTVPVTMTVSTLTIAFGSLSSLIIALSIYFLYFLSPRQLPYPPGPRGLPLLGNALDMPREREWETYSDWARKYGRIVSVTALGLRMIIVNEVHLEQELFENRGAIYSGRYVPAMMPLYASLKLSGYHFIINNTVSQNGS